MKKAGITQEKLAEELQMTQGGVQHWLAGTRQPSLEDINRIAAVINATPAWLTHGLKEDEILDGLDEAPRAALRRFIQAERAEKSPSSLWATLNSIADLSLGPPQNTREQHDQHADARRIGKRLEEE